MEDVKMEPVQRLQRDILIASKILSKQEARFLVDAYYQMQEDRKRANNQVLALHESAEPNSVLVWLANQSETLEKQVGRALDTYSNSHPVGRWMREIDGIGPIIAAGLLAHIDIEKAPTVGHIWSFAGVVPGVKWEKGQKRPWNASLKVLLYKIGESFVKVKGKETAYYGHIYEERRKLEIARNDAGLFVEQAKQELINKKFGKDTDARKWYTGCYPAGTTAAVLALDSPKRADYLAKHILPEGTGQPMLPPAHIFSRAKRYAVKLFIAHLHEVWRKAEGLPVPNPYAIQFLGHAHKIEPPHQLQS